MNAPLPASQTRPGFLRKVETLEHLELGMEVVWRIEAEDFSAFVIDGECNDFHGGLE